MHTLDIKKIIFWGICAAAMFAAFLYYEDLELSGFAILLLLLLICGVFANSIREDASERKAGFSVSETDKGTDISARDPSYDILRILAALCVVASHVFQTDTGIMAPEEQSRLLLFMGFATLVCNPIYVMLSGALLLRWKEESPGTFYRRRLLKIVLPLIVYYTFYLWENRIICDMPLSEALLLIFGNLISGKTPETPYYWLIFTIISLYIAFPFIRYMLRDLPYDLLRKLSLLSILMMGAASYLPVLLGGSAINSFLGSWMGIALLGYFLSRKETRAYDPFIIGIGAIALLLMGGALVFGLDYMTLCTGTTPVMTLFAMGIMALVLRLPKIREPHVLRVLAFISRHSYGIILIHWWVIFWPVKRHFGLGTAPLSGTVCLFITAVTFLISLLGAFGIDRLIIYPTERFLETVRKSLHKLHIKA